jgi:WD40 repeat protein
VKKQKVVRDYGKISEHICSIAITSDDKYLWTSDYNGNVKQFSVRNGQMIKDFGAMFEHGIRSLMTTPDNKWLFVGSWFGDLKQICLESQQLVHDYENVHDKGIYRL